MAEAKKPLKKRAEAVKEDIPKKKTAPEKTATSEKPSEATAEPKIPVAKAGKRSTKAVVETEAKAAKEERKKTTAGKAGVESKSKTVPPAGKRARDRLERAGKKYRQAAKQIERGKTYSLAEAIELAIKTAVTKFDGTVELHINLAVDPKQADQNVRGLVVLPHGTGKTARVAVFVEGPDVDKAKQAGADITGSDELMKLFDKEQADFDTLISTPAMMPQLGKYAKFLGPKGLMPNPKSGTITNDIAKAVKEAKAGKIEYLVDQQGIIHLAIGKASFGPQKLLDNATAVMTSVRAAKPASVKGMYIKSAYVTTTMGPSIKIEV